MARPGRRSPLYLACDGGGEGRLAAAELLIAAGAHLQRGNTNGAPLHAAARRGPAALVEMLLEAGALS